MIHVAIALWITSVGVVLLAPASRWLDRIGVATLAPAFGTAAYLIVGTVLAAAGLFSVVAALAVALAAVGAAGAYRRANIDWRASAVGGGIALVVTALVAVAALSANTTRFTNDSYSYIMSASHLDATGSLDGGDSRSLVKKQLAVPLIQATGWLDETGYAPVLGPLFGVAALAAFGWLALRLLGRAGGGRIPRGASALVAAGILLLVTTNRFVFAATYINGHMLYAMLLLGAVGLAWLALHEDERGWLWLVGIAFLATSLVRAEALMVVAFFMVPLLADQRLERTDRFAIVLPASLFGVVWFGLVLPPHANAADFGARSMYLNAALAGALGVFAVAAGIPRLQRLVRLAPAMMLAATLVAIAVYGWNDPELLADSLHALAVNAAAEGAWGFFWYAVVPLGAAAVMLSRSLSDRMMTFGIAGFFFALPLVAFLRDNAFRIGSGDSGNRMLVHIAPLLLLYVIVTTWRDSAATEAPDRSPLDGR